VCTGVGVHSGISLINQTYLSPLSREGIYFFSRTEGPIDYYHGHGTFFEVD